jgi:hypothetical protein
MNTIKRKEDHQPTNLGKGISGYSPKNIPVLNEMEKRDIYTINAIHTHLKIVKNSLRDVKAGRVTTNIEDHLQLVSEHIGELSVTGRHNKFLSKQSKKFWRLSKRTCKIIGEKKKIDGIYQ